MRAVLGRTAGAMGKPRTRSNPKGKHVRKAHLCTSTEADPPIFPKASWKKMKSLSPVSKGKLVNEASAVLKLVKEHTAAWPSREPSPKKAKTNGKAKVID